MSESGIVDRYERFMGLIGMRHDAEWLQLGVTDSQLALTQEALGVELPADLCELLSIHNGVRLFDEMQWLPCSKSADIGLARLTRWFHNGMDEDAFERSDLVPGPHTLYAAAESQVGILYDLDDRPGRLFYFDVLADQAVIPLARDLVTLMDCYLDLAEAGYVTVGPLGPEVDGTRESLHQVRGIFVRNQVAHALRTGTDTWLAWPGSADFSID